MSTAVVDPAGPVVERPRRTLPSWAPGVLGFVGLIVVWQILGVAVSGSTGAFPPPSAILSEMRVDGWSFYDANIIATVRVAALGWLWGNTLAIITAVAFVMVPFLEKALLRLAVASYCLPIIAIGPILVIVFSGDTPKIILAALSVYFTTLIGALVGLRSADRTSLELVRAYGGNRWTELRKVRAKSSLPSLFAALCIAAPAAMLGALIGEYMGADTGLGVAMINSQQALKVERTWGIALVATVIAGLAYAVIALIGRLLTPWAPRTKR